MLRLMLQATRSRESRRYAVGSKHKIAVTISGLLLELYAVTSRHSSELR